MIEVEVYKLWHYNCQLKVTIESIPSVEWQTLLCADEIAPSKLATFFP
jgi:hypothetical protein